jgi:anti-sigma-K factor RskA
MTHDDVRETLPLFAVGADDRATRTELLEHLATCEECRRLLRDYQQAADALTQSVPQIRPRPELRARTLSAIVGSGSPQAASPSPTSTPAVTSPAVPARTGWAPWLAAAAALVAAIATAGMLQMRAEVADLRATVAQWQARVADAEARVADAERNAQASQATLVTYRRQLDVMTADDLILVSLGGLPPANAAQGKAFVSRSQNAILFTARDLPALPAARVYQLWAVAGGQAISAGTFVPDAQGRSQLVADVPALTVRPDALAVTVEPEGGVPAPTGPKYLLGVPAN